MITEKVLKANKRYESVTVNRNGISKIQYPCKNIVFVFFNSLSTNGE